MRRIYNYNNLKCSLNIARLRLKLITELNYKNYDDEKLSLRNEITTYKKIIKYIDSKLKTLNDVQLYLFKKITCENYSITKAIEETSYNCGYEIGTIWKNYYPKIKPIIKELEIKEEL